MKKLITLVLACMLTVCCFLFSGCGEKGTYKFDCLKYEDNDTTITIDIGEKYQGVELTQDWIVVELKDDNVAIISVKIGDESEASVGEWRTGDDDKIYITVDGETIVCEKDGNTLKMEMLGVTMYLKK